MHISFLAGGGGLRLEVLGRLEGGAKRWTDEIIAQKTPKHPATCDFAFGFRGLTAVLGTPPSPPPSKASSLQRNLARIDRTATKTLERHRTHCVAGTLKKVLGGTGRAASKPITRRRTAWRALPASKIPASIGRPKPTGLGRN